MSHISVRLTNAGLAIVAAAMVGGSAIRPDQPEEPAAQLPPTALHVEVHDQPEPEVADLQWQKSECDAPMKGEGMSSLLIRLSRLVDPQIPANEVESAKSPNGSLYLQAKARNPNGESSELGTVDSICVVRTPNGADAPTWWVHYPGYVARTAYR